MPTRAYLVDVENLPRGLLHLAHLMHEIPEPRLGHDLVGREEFHAVRRWVLLLLGLAVGPGRLAAHHLIQAHLRGRRLWGE